MNEGRGSMLNQKSVIQSFSNSISGYYPITLGLFSGFLVFYFLYFLDAFGIQKGLSYSGHSHLFRSLSFGVLTFLFFVTFEWLVKPKINLTTYRSKVAWYLLLIFLDSQLTFLMFNFFWNWQEWNLEAYFLIIKEFPLLMALPLLLYLMLGRILRPQKSVAPIFTFQSENGKDQLKINPENFLYANAAENYITIFYLFNDHPSQHLIRKPFKTLEQELEKFPAIKRCHRSYLINMVSIDAIKQAKGKVTLEIAGHSIPVSKQYQVDFLH
ncbi:MAG: LytTR family transcriptional regulator [Saprospiraceae bacterium]|nr:LytTR family transcriptional regulator [Saprospiraceae bacterium]